MARPDVSAPELEVALGCDGPPLLEVDGVAVALTLRPMTESDLSEVSAIEQQVAPQGWNYEIFRNALLVGYPGWVLCHRSQMIGYGMITAAAGEAHLLNIAISPTHQRRGLGSWLLLLLLSQAQQAGATTLFLEVRASNHAAIALYLRHGFERIGIRRGYYATAYAREDALVFSKQLVEEA